MARCLQLAKKGIRNVFPNPMVGCVIVHQQKIIGEGYHEQFGAAHAEVNAINSVKDKHLLTNSTLYVNLEPCAHFGKTPPCADLITKYNIPKVVIGCVDSFAAVAGKGITKLKTAGIEVMVGILEKESLALNKRFFTFHQKKRPYVLLKWAVTQDGFMDVERTNSNTIKDNWITSPTSKKLVHKWRSEEAAIMIGTNTALNDNPQLTVRDWTRKNPIRIVLDMNLRLPTSLQIFNTEADTIVLNSIKDEEKGNILYLKINPENWLNDSLTKLYERHINSILVEGGKQLLTSFINENLWDEARVFTGNKTFGTGLSAPEIKAAPNYTEKIADDWLNVYENSN